MKKFLAIVLLIMMGTMSISLAEEYEVINSYVEMQAVEDTELRLWATNDAPVYGVLPEGETVDVVSFCPDEENVWAEIRRNDTEYRYGYIDMADLCYSDGRQFNFAEFMKVTGNTVNIREYESINAPVCGLLYKNDIVQVTKLIPTSDGRIWAACHSADDSEFFGWVSIKYLTVVDFVC